MEKNTIDYVIPQLNKKGGIQNLALNTYNTLETKYNIRLNNYHYDSSPLNYHLLNILPSNLSSRLFQLLYNSHYNKKYNFKNSSLIHFWHIDAAMTFVDKKYVISCYGEEILPKNTQNFKLPFYKDVLINAKKIIVISEFTKKLVLNIVPDLQTIEIIYPSINFSEFSNIKKFKQKRLIIGTISRFVPRKNIPNIIKSLQIFHNKYKIDFEFHLAGDGPEKKIILKELQSVDFKWKYLGDISDPDKYNKFYPTLDIFILPTLNIKNSIEGFGIVYIEANSFGIPVIASKVGGAEEAVKEKVSGLFTNPEDPEEISTKLYQLVQNYNNYFDSSKKWASNFDAEVNKFKWLKLYNNSFFMK